MLEDTLLRACAFGRIHLSAFNNALAGFWRMRSSVEMIIFTCGVGRFAFDAAKQFRICTDIVCSSMNECAAIQAGKISAILFAPHGLTCKLGENGEKLVTG
jgi:hypothetical protein